MIDDDETQDLQFDASQTPPCNDEVSEPKESST